MATAAITPRARNSSPHSATRQVVYYDHRGHGRSDAGEPDRWNLDQWADDLVALCDALGIDRPVVFGFSFGGNITLNYAIRYPDRLAKISWSLRGPHQPGSVDSHVRTTGRTGRCRCRRKVICSAFGNVGGVPGCVRSLLEPATPSPELGARIVAPRPGVTEHVLRHEYLQHDYRDRVAAIRCQRFFWVVNLTPSCPLTKSKTQPAGCNRATSDGCGWHYAGDASASSTTQSTSAVAASVRASVRECPLNRATRECDNRTIPIEATARELIVRNGDVSLAGSLWLPVDPAGVTVLMHPGSGPSDRDNDVFFPPIRRQLLGSGIAVSSFDKRGVGASSGRWQEAAIEEQASDAIACLDALQADSSLDGPVGLYGHSQGGWVVVEAAARCLDVAFVVTSSGPGVTPGEQERWAARSHLTRAGIPANEIEEVGRYYDRIIAIMRSGIPLAAARERVEANGFPQAFTTLSLPVLPEDEADWQLFTAIVDYDPRPALERIEVPVLAMFGADDPITPVDDSVAVFREAGRAGLVHVEVFAGAGHGLETGDPPTLVDGYLETLASFVLAVARS